MEDRTDRPDERGGFGENGKPSLGTVNAGEQIMQIVPLGEKLLVETRVTPRDIADLHQINKEFLNARTAVDASEVDFRFHTRLVAVMGNKAILDVYKIMKPVIMKIMLKAKTLHTFSTVTYSEHAEIVDMLEKRDRTAYQYKMKSHLDAGFRHFVD